jgi:hypothetical protein
MRDYPFQAHDLEYPGNLNSPASLATLNPVADKPASALVGKADYQGTPLNLDTGPSNAENLRVSDLENLPSFSEIMAGDTPISPISLPNCVWEDSANVQLPRCMYPTQIQRSPTPINGPGVSTQSPTCKKQGYNMRYKDTNGLQVGSCTWGGFDCGAESFSNLSFDMFSRISSNSNLAASLEQEILLSINPGRGLFYRLPWFQLLEVIERPGQLLSSFEKDES